MSSLEYAQARLSSRHGERPDDTDWRRLEHVREFAAAVDVARNCALRTWMGGISAVSLPHEIEAVLRGHWRDHVAEVARWMPDTWRPAVLWCASVVDLAVLASLAQGHATLPWMREDPLYRDLVDAGPGTCPVAFAKGPLSPLAAGWGDPGRIVALWRAEWDRRAPADGDLTLRAELGRTLLAHLATFHDPALKDGWPVRRALQARLTLLFRRAMLDPAAAFIYLASIALDLERLRGELLRRAAFPGLPLVA